MKKSSSVIKTFGTLESFIHNKKLNNKELKFYNRVINNYNTCDIPKDVNINYDCSIKLNVIDNKILDLIKDLRKEISIIENNIISEATKEFNDMVEHLTILLSNARWNSIGFFSTEVSAQKITKLKNIKNYETGFADDFLQKNSDTITYTKSSLASNAKNKYKMFINFHYYGIENIILGKILDTKYKDEDDSIYLTDAVVIIDNESFCSLDISNKSTEDKKQIEKFIFDIYLIMCHLHKISDKNFPDISDFSGIDSSHNIFSNHKIIS